MDTPIVVSTRVLNEEHRAILEGVNISLVECDFISVSPIDFQISELNEFLLFTSQNAVRSVLKHKDIAVLKSKLSFCVGVKTKELLEKSGWKVVAWADYAKELAPILIKSFSTNSISFFNGNLRSEVLPNAFNGVNVKFNEFQVYQTDLTPIALSQKPHGICFYSPSGVDSYLKENKITDEVCFCIGDTTAEALKNNTNKIILAKQPTIEKTLQACVTYYK
ncbi:uroporphyrinogen-III synthase [Myroides guanonis]|uniref:Uroporphyrinogen-III synthase n=1 Tax=Myroides guanonis TaxID=1150112 RepID=A0A1I3SH07_9FLAO|nr:uroporphyrinogen-III synthase [Myroides guanonis]SFJ58044.1 uroporphyrinogen-III synthase [Myroides guanonis]